MTKDELKKEAEKYAEQCYGWTNNDLAIDVAKATYIVSAEPREKQIAELEKENAELIKHLERIKLAQAKVIIKNILRVTWGEGWNYSLDWKVKAEQFLNEVEK